MSWMQMLYETYEYNAGVVGMASGKATLTPIAHMMANTQIEIMINAQGELLQVSPVAKEDSQTLIPVTEESASRTVGIAPHSLSDYLSYVAGDFVNYVVSDKDKKSATKKHNQYVEALKSWAESEYSHSKVRTIYEYVKQGHMMEDILQSGIGLELQDGHVPDSKFAGCTYDKLMVRFIVVGDSVEPATWKDHSLIDTYVNYYCSQGGNKDICYLTGEYQTKANVHPKGIVRAAYGAKLVSSNDSTNFTYRGRFNTSDEACVISYVGTQKAHAALTWLAAMQGVLVGSKDRRTFVLWNPKGKQIPDVDDDLEDVTEEDSLPLTEPLYKKRLWETMEGYRNTLTSDDDIVAIGLDAATTGRLSITLYSELNASQFLQNLLYWRETCCWYYTIYTKDNKPLNLVTSPSTRDIARFAYGTERGAYVDVDDRVLKEQVQRIYQCIIDGRAVPYDLVHALVEKASMPQNYKSVASFRKVQATACAFVRKYYNDKAKKEVYGMELNLDERDRSYLFGRLLAIAEQVERITYDANDRRTTNALKLQTTFVSYPLRTWSTLEKALNPYYQRLEKEGKAYYYKKQIEDILSLLNETDVKELNMRLKDTYLLGYYLQRREFYKPRIKEDETENKENVSNKKEDN